MTLKHTNSNGFTLVEPLVALVVVSILLTAITPIIILATATRIQARRVELASQAARAYIDGVRSGAIQYPPGTTTRLEDYAAPTSSGSLNCTANAYCSSTPELYCVDFDGSGCSNSSLTDMVVQAFRLNSAAVEPSQGYTLGLRVYRADAFKEPGTLKREPQQATFTGGLGDIKAPLLETTTDIATDQTSFRDFCARLSCGKR
ncbi:MAG: hormogonium polysaccharide secretion pseudopilin HpsB [Chroococcidiopsidaceae cyanobacterium CP_BM_ER_R8_30]|nr:hormogonium polysaccharide secretion pseudopilin HpsB [Chroococcidiopsidaceae cyanobacterium CP_BM_ER_R8_30]